MQDHQASAVAFKRYYETLTPDSARQPGLAYAANATFKDPYQEVSGHAAIQAVFLHMFAQLDMPRFVVSETVVQGDQAFLIWDFHFRMKRWNRDPITIHGTTHIRFDDAGLVTMHRDYWDLAGEFYEKLPLIGGLMRALKKAGSSH